MFGIKISDKVDQSCKTNTEPILRREASYLSRVSFSGGVSIDPFPPTAGDSVSVTYSGLLANSGADRVYAHVGYGLGKWSDIKDIEMSRQGDRYVANVRMEPGDMFNLCFKDSANNWDNNNGNNWSTKITSRRY